MPLTQKRQFDRETLENFIASRNEPDWVQKRRRSAFENYQQFFEEPLPEEEWKRVDLRIFQPDRFHIVRDTQTRKPLKTALQDRTRFGGQSVQLNSQSVEVSLNEQIEKQGVVFGSLADLIHTHASLIQPNLMTKAVLPACDRFSAWHAAFWTGGTFLYIPKNVTIEEPLHSLLALSKDGAADFSHTLIILEEGASATLLEETVSTDETIAGLHVGAVELLVAPRANLRYVQLQNWNRKTYHFAHQTGKIDRDARLEWTVAGLGSCLAHVHQDIELDGRGAEAVVNGVSFAHGRQLISYYTQQTHHAPNTNSDLLYKQVLRDQSRAVWRGMIKVDPQAQQTDGYQRNDALLLSSDCRNDAIPGLEIEADDVRCTHGATAGRVDEEQLFYTMSRGMTEFEAMHMIVEGFFQKVYDRIGVESVRETLRQTVEKKLGIGD